MTIVAFLPVEWIALVVRFELVPSDALKIYRIIVLAQRSCISMSDGQRTDLTSTPRRKLSRTSIRLHIRFTPGSPRTQTSDNRVNRVARCIIFVVGAK